MIFVPEEEIQQVNYRSEGINGRRLFSRGVGGGGGGGGPSIYRPGGGGDAFVWGHFSPLPPPPPPPPLQVSIAQSLILT